MKCFKPFEIHSQSEKNPIGIEVPCGKCLACKQNRAKEWAMRLFHEWTYWETSSFITLTYDEEHLPAGDFPSIDKTHLQLFFKRLRKNIDQKNKLLPEDKKIKIKYFACGEYGDTYGRPHYHAILFGFDEYQTIHDTWGKGIVHVGTVTAESIRYVANYVEKKYYDKTADHYYTSTGRTIPFQLQSQGHGLRFAFDNTEYLKNNLYVSQFGIKNPIPRYYRKKIDITINDYKPYMYTQKNTMIKLFKAIGITKCGDKFRQIINARRQNEITLRAKINLRNSQNKKL